MVTASPLAQNIVQIECWSPTLKNEKLLSSSNHTSILVGEYQAIQAILDVVLTVEGFLPCLEAIKGLKDCSVEILKSVFGLPLDTSCCQVVNQIAINCLPKGFPLSQTFFHVAVGNCINASAPPASD
ncbi:Prolamin-like domain [Forsythia ovata]|uniref:Prolamin-like domain n=1 Tax=Forsythia ovata TaxID=205694 RepID=A0ABD1UZJ1_9LAMI